MAIGRISGQMLLSNLLRDGVDLSIETDLLYFDVTNGKIGIGNATPSHKLTVDGNITIGNLETTGTSFILPVGNLLQRPDPAVVGMIRVNPSTLKMEFYDSVKWQSVYDEITIVTSDVFIGNGNANSYVLTENSTTNSSIVSFDGIVKLPTTDYSVTGNVLTFVANVPSNTVVEVRGITATDTIVELVSSDGFNTVSTADGQGIGFHTGTASKTLRWRIDTNGNFFPVADNAYDIGASGNTRPRTAYIGTSVITPLIGTGSTTPLSLSTSGGIGLKVGDGSSVTNFLNILGSSSTSAITVYPDGTGSSIGLAFGTKSSGSHTFKTNILQSNGVEQFRITHTANAVNFWTLTGGANASPSSIDASAVGDSDNISMRFFAKGSASYIGFWGHATEQVRILATSSADRILTLTGSAGGNPTISTSAGNLAITPAVEMASNLTIGGSFFNNLSIFSPTTSSELAGVISDETGSGNLVFDTSPTLVTPVVSGGSIDDATVGSTTRAAGAFTTLLASDQVTANAAIASANTTSGTIIVTGGVGVSGNIYLGGILNATGNITGGNVSGTIISGTLSTVAQPNITSVGTLSGGTWNANIIAGQYGGTGIDNTNRTITLGGNLVTSGANTITFTSTNTTSVTLPTSGTLATTGDLSQFSATTSAQLAGVISDETGSGNLVFNNTPTLTSPAVTGGSINDTTVGATTRTTGAFTTLLASGAVTANVGTASANTTSGAVVITGGVGVSGNVNLGEILTATGNITGGNISGARLASTIATGTAPLIIASNTAVANLNADLLDSIDSVNFQKQYPLPGNVSATWVNLGTYTAGQSGNTISVRMVTHAGFSANLSQNQVVRVYFKTSDGTVNGDGFAGDSSWWSEGRSTTAVTEIKWKSNAAGNAAVSYDLFANVAANINSSFYTVEQTSGTWSHIGLGGQTDPGANSNTVVVSTQEYYVGTTITGTTTSALYSDLAEKYVADAYYDPGTVLEFGGSQEVTMATDNSSKIAGVVSTKPGFVMNEQLSGPTVIMLALQGRVPCKVVGEISKGDLMVSAGNGYARAEENPKIGTVIGKSIENFYGEDGIIEIVVGRV